MRRSWTIGKKIGASFATTVGLAIVIAVVATLALRSVVASKDSVIAVNAQNLIVAEKLDVASNSHESALLGYLLSRDPNLLDSMRRAKDDFYQFLSALKSAGDERGLIARIAQEEIAHKAAAERIIALRDSNAAIDSLVRTFASEVEPRFAELSQAIDAYVAEEEKRLEEAKLRGTDTAHTAITMVLVIAVLSVLASAILGWFVTAGLGRQIGSAIHHVQSSSSELQAAANQQATGAKEQAAATNETTTTIKELVATARQIAESAQRVATIAEDTATAARSGDQTIQRARETLGVSKRQVDLIVAHMLELGKKSQQIGGILEVINELSEQTNILAINATIEAAGAGESGKRFTVVADEIRKLADRVGGSTKDIRSLIEEMRSAVNTTVMATEAGTKAVDAGTRQFVDVAAAFGHIVGLVGTTTEAAREIELSTKQQTTAVEQVNVAMANVAQAAKETETSSSQTLVTAAQLATLSKDLSRLIQTSVRA